MVPTIADRCCYVLHSNINMHLPSHSKSKVSSNLQDWESIKQIFDSREHCTCESWTAKTLSSARTKVPSKFSRVQQILNSEGESELKSSATCSPEMFLFPNIKCRCLMVFATQSDCGWIGKHCTWNRTPSAVKICRCSLMSKWNT